MTMTLPSGTDAARLTSESARVWQRRLGGEVACPVDRLVRLAEAADASAADLISWALTLAARRAKHIGEPAPSVRPIRDAGLALATVALEVRKLMYDGAGPKELVAAIDAAVEQSLEETH